MSVSTARSSLLPSGTQGMDALQCNCLPAGGALGFQFPTVMNSAPTNTVDGVRVDTSFISLCKCPWVGLQHLTENYVYLLC